MAKPSIRESNLAEGFAQEAARADREKERADKAEAIIAQLRAEVVAYRRHLKFTAPRTWKLEIERLRDIIAKSDGSGRDAQGGANAAIDS
jgi:hypothetical protein